MLITKAESGCAHIIDSSKFLIAGCSLSLKEASHFCMSVQISKSGVLTLLLKLNPLGY